MQLDDFDALQRQSHTRSLKMAVEKRIQHDGPRATEQSNDELKWWGANADGPRATQRSQRCFGDVG